MNKAIWLLPLALMSVQGQQPAVKLTLRGAVDLALRQNPQIQIAKLQIAESQQDSVIAKSGLLPQVGLSITETVQRGNIEATLGKRIPGFPQHVGPFPIFQPGAQASLSVFDLSLWNRYKASKSMVDSQTALELSTREQYVLLVVSQYLGSLRASADITAAQSRFDLAKALFDLASDLQKNGAGTRIDTLRAQVQMQNEQQRLIVAKTQFETSLYALARLLNIPAVELDDAGTFFQTPEFPGESALTSALQQRPEMKALAAQMRSLELQEKAAKAENLPKVSVIAGYSLQGTHPNNAIPAYSFGAELSMPIYTGGRIGAVTAKAQIEIKKLQQQRQELENQIGQEVKTSQAELKAARTQVDVANSTVELAKEEVTQARDRFSAGVANNIEVITAQDELARASDQQIAALYRYNQARADLARATGQMELMYTR